jgi:hypothetical protein
MIDRDDALSSATFKAVPGGWVYRAPNPWVFGNAPHYLVNDIQKAEIEAALTPSRPTLVVCAVVVGIFVWALAVTTFMWAFSGHDNPTPGDLAIMIPLIAIPILALLPLAALIQRGRLSAVLATAQRTTERISYSELSKKIQRATPLKQLLNACIASIFASFAATTAILVHLAGRHFIVDTFATAWGIVAVIFGGLSVVWYRRVLRKADAS